MAESLPAPEAVPPERTRYQMEARCSLDHWHTVGFVEAPTPEDAKRRVLTGGEYDGPRGDSLRAVRADLVRAATTGSPEGAVAALIADLEQRIQRSEEGGEDKDAASWNYQEGMLLSRAEAQLALAALRSAGCVSDSSAEPGDLRAVLIDRLSAIPPTRDVMVLADRLAASLTADGWTLVRRSSAPAPATEPSVAQIRAAAIRFCRVGANVCPGATACDHRACTPSTCGCAALAAALGSSAPAPGGATEDATTRALHNVLLLAIQRRRSGFREGDADHLIRFCREGGVEANPLRAADRTREDAGEPDRWAWVEQAQAAVIPVIGGTWSVELSEDPGLTGDADVIRFDAPTLAEAIDKARAASPSPRRGTREDGNG